MTIVVGVDNSDGSRAALRWALSYARVTGATVQAITAWQDPSMYGTYGMVPDPYGPGGIAATAEQALAKPSPTSSRRWTNLSRYAPQPPKDAPPRSCSRQPSARTYSSSEAAATERLSTCCWDRSASTASSIRRAPSSSSRTRRDNHDRNRAIGRGLHRGRPDRPPRADPSLTCVPPSRPRRGGTAENARVHQNRPLAAVHRPRNA